MRGNGTIDHVTLPQLPSASVEGHLAAAAKESDRVATKMVGAGVEDRFGRILRKIDAAHVRGRVRSGGVEREAGKGDDAARWHLQRHTFAVAGVTDQIIAAGL